MEITNFRLKWDHQVPNYNVRIQGPLLGDFFNFLITSLARVSALQTT